MIIWEDQTVTLVRQTTKPVDLINRVARVCYSSVTPENEDKQCEFIKKLIDKGHESPLEFVDFIWFIQTSRAIANELVRHRLASYMQESTRYVKYDNLEMIKDPSFKTNSIIEDRLEGLFTQYKSLVQNGTRKEMARDFLPLGMATRIYCKMNLREFRHFLRLRANPAAHPMMRDLARQMVAEVIHANTPKFVEAYLHGLELYY